VPIIAVVLMLMSANVGKAAPAFVAGWLAGLGAVAGVVTAVADPAGAGTEGGRPVVGWLVVVLGLVFVVMAGGQWRKRPSDGQPADLPKWMPSIDRMRPAPAAGIGVLLSAGNLKNVTLAMSAALSIAQHDLSPGVSTAAVAVFVLAGSLTVVGPVAAALVWRQQVARLLVPVKDWFVRENATVLFVVLLVLGVVLIGKGVVTIVS
jgi:hypothetical protein